VSAREEDIIEAMLRYGGGFVSKLGALYRQADTHNQAILRSAFAHYWREYAEIVEQRRPRWCPICGCYQFVYQGDRQVCADCGRE
jgi:hypothetical protein